jgi:hypothetical protein
MTYEFKCVNEECKVQNISIDIPLKDYGKEPVKCPQCNNDMQRVYSSFGAKTSDGYKS